MTFIFLFLTYFTLYIHFRFIYLIRTESNAFLFMGYCFVVTLLYFPFINTSFIVFYKNIYLFI